MERIILQSVCTNIEISRQSFEPVDIALSTGDDYEMIKTEWSFQYAIAEFQIFDGTITNIEYGDESIIFHWSLQTFPLKRSAKDLGK